ncbi:hypothetical protein QP997_01570 [Corynebacterium sp. MSK039]|nr:hypothetical protein [Corynebacterium sp. MSK039]MDK8790422.1 hypothetical protein [Corynebacterium sp. MSK039]
MPNAVNVLFQMTFAMIATAIISGSLANRVKIHTWLIFTAVWVVLVYAPMAHMVWGGGLLGEGANSMSAWLFGAHVEGAETVANIAPIDFAGGTVIHINAGVAGLVLASFSISLKHRLGWRISAEEENTGIDVTHHRERAYHALVDATVAQRE